tara:strand:- start:1605 stop:1901 length:297 start_codon:yes stop_codon:yes gene_type:complete
MSITVVKPEALSWKHPNVGGICTREGVITEWNTSLPTLTQDLIDGYDQQYQAHLDATAYIPKRVAEYPSTGDQLDMIYKDIDAWKVVVKAVKDKYPKE